MAKSRKTKKGDLTTTQIIMITLAVMLLIVAVMLYKVWVPNPERVAGCFTEAVKIGPFA